MKFHLPNDDLGFVRGLTLCTPGAQLIDLRIGVSRVREPMHWDTVPFRQHTVGELTEVQFERPDNWANLAFDLVTDVSCEPRGRLDHLPVPDGAALRALLRGKRCVFLGAARNCASALPASVAKLRELAALFGQAEIRVYENDSSDHTGELLDSMARDGLLSSLRETGIAARMPLRTDRLAYARNRLLRGLLPADPAAPLDWDYVCWADMDGLVGERFSVDGFLSNFIAEPAWDAVFPLSWPLYYDYWALREDVICRSDYVWDGRHRFNAALAHSAGVHAVTQQLAPGKVRGWLPVQSAFGGFGLYKAEVVHRGRYVGSADGEEVCEHVPYHQQLLRAGARLFINPACITHIA